VEASLETLEEINSLGSWLAPGYLAEASGDHHNAEFANKMSRRSLRQSADHISCHRGLGESLRGCTNRTQKVPALPTTQTNPTAPLVEPTHSFRSHRLKHSLSTRTHILLLLFFLAGTVVSAANPVIYYTDQVTGVTTGGENNDGSYLTINGNNFGSVQSNSTVEINGTAVAQYIAWSNTQIGVQVGAVTTGAITVTVGSNTAMGPTWTARSGTGAGYRIFFIGTSADGSNRPSCSSLISGSTGTFSFPWGLTNTISATEGTYSSLRTPTFYANCLAAGDTLVFLDGVDYAWWDGRNLHSSLWLGDVQGTSGNPLVIMSRPGATVTLGGYNSTGTSSGVGPLYGLRAGIAYVNVSGIHFSSGVRNGSGAAFSYDASSSNQTLTNHRFVNNDVQCPFGNGPSGCLSGIGPNSVVYGNHVHNISTNAASSKEYHAIYFDCCLAGQTLDLGWNVVSNSEAIAVGVGPYNGIQFNDNGGVRDPTLCLTGFTIHDNDISGVNGSGINFSTVGFGSPCDASHPPSAYNNIIHHVGLAAAAGGSGGDPHSCFAYKGYSSDTTSGTVSIYNNTMYDCSGYLNSANFNCSACIVDLAKQTSVTRLYVNNICFQPTYTYTGGQNVHMAGGRATDAELEAVMVGSNHNMWYSASTPGDSAFPGTGTVINPGLNNPSGGDFTPVSGSPAIGGGTDSLASVADFNGTVRRSPPSAGAYEFPNAAFSPCDLGHYGVVNARDVQLAVDEILGATGCTFSPCNAVMVQDVINAALGGVCHL
jgi:hypothetical protein